MSFKRTNLSWTSKSLAFKYYKSWCGPNNHIVGFNSTYDAYCCKTCNRWLEEECSCGPEDDCPFPKPRPDKPFPDEMYVKNK